MRYMSIGVGTHTMTASAAESRLMSPDNRNVGWATT